MFTKSVDSIISQFDKMVVELQKVIEENQKRVATNNSAILKLKESNTALNAEKERASNIASKLNSIIN